MIAAVILAAGASTRFGGHKLLAPLGDRPVVRHAVERVLAGAVDDVVVVLGRDAEAVQEALAGLPVRFVVNARFAEGMSSSLRAGVAALARATEAVVVALGDQPTLPADVIPALVRTFRETGAPIVAPSYDGERGNPVLFTASLFAELRSVNGDQGAREVIRAHAADVHLVAFDFPPPRDVDDVADLHALRAELRRSTDYADDTD